MMIWSHSGGRLLENGFKWWFLLARSGGRGGQPAVVHLEQGEWGGLTLRHLDVGRRQT